MDVFPQWTSEKRGNCPLHLNVSEIKQRFRTRRAGLSVRLQVDPSGTGTAGGFGSRSQETEMAAASIIHRTRVMHYRWRHTNRLSLPTVLLSRLAWRQGKIGANKTKTQNLQIQRMKTRQGTQASPKHQ